MERKNVSKIIARNDNVGGIWRDNTYPGNVKQALQTQFYQGLQDKRVGSVWNSSCHGENHYQRLN
jgi:hypothetical protein